MRFTFDVRKTAQAAGYILTLAPVGMTDGELIKVLYLADRRALQETGLPITGDQAMSMENGPALSKTLDLARGIGTDEELNEWRAHVSSDCGPDMVAASGARTDALSPYQKRLIEETVSKYGRHDFSALQRVGHALPECEAVTNNERPKPIDPLAILRAAGLSNDEIEEMEQLAQEREAMLRVAPATR